MLSTKFPGGGRRAPAGVALLALIACLAVGVAPANARHRPGCNARCRQLSSAGSGAPGSGGGGSREGGFRTALLRHRVHRHGHFVDVKLRCLRQHKTCRGVLELEGRSSKAPDLARMKLNVPARRSRTLAVRLSKAGLAYLRGRRSVRAILSLDYPRNQSDSFRMTIIG